MRSCGKNCAHTLMKAKLWSYARRLGCSTISIGSMMPSKWIRRSRFLALALLSPLAVASCLSPEDAAKHIGKTTCVARTVTKITQGPKGVQYIDFCEQHERCGFYGVVFAGDLRDVGDIRT